MTNPGLKMSHDGADRVRHFQPKVSQLVEELLLHHLRAGSIKNDDDDPSMRGYISSPGAVFWEFLLLFLLRYLLLFSPTSYQPRVVHGSILCDPTQPNPSAD